MGSFLIEIHPKRAEFDPLGRQVKTELIEAGEDPKKASVETSRLFKIEGNLTPQQAQNAATTLLLDPVVETATVEDLAPASAPQKARASAGKPAKAPKLRGGFILDVWPKAGVTDPVGETVQKGLRDLGIAGDVKASSAQRYFFPKSSNESLIKRLAKRSLANELIHAIDVRKA
jgi:phosphoribosylformylglycinamidine synthase subunit PurSL